MGTYLQEIESIQSGPLKPSYLLYGNDFFVRDEMQKALIEAFEKARGKAERFVYYAQDDKDNQFLDAMTTRGLFATAKVVVYKDFHKVQAKTRNQVLKYLDSLDENILLILGYNDKRKSWFNSFAKKMTQLSVWTPYDNQYAGLVKLQLKKMGLTINPRALNILVQETGDSFTHTFAEIDKILIGMGERTEINETDIRKIGGSEKNFQIDDFVESLNRKDYGQAVKVCKALIEAKAETPLFIAVMQNHFFNVWAFKSVVEKRKNVGSRPQRDTWSRGAYKYSGADFEKIFNLLTEADKTAKSASLTTEEIMVPLLYQIINC